METTYKINDDNSVSIYKEGNLIQTYGEKDVYENAEHYYETAGFSPAKSMIDSVDYNSLIEETLMINFK